MTYQSGLRRDQGTLAPGRIRRVRPPAPEFPRGVTASVPTPAPATVTPAARSSLGWLALWMTGTLLSFTISALSVRALAPTLNPFEMMSIRSAGGLAILLVLLLAYPELRRGLAFRHMRLHACRSTIHFVSQISWTIAITALPLATVFALEFTMPAWVAVLAVIFLGERLTNTRIGSIIVCFLGVLVIVRPGLAFQPASLIALGAAIAMATTAIFTKKLTATETTFSILFWMNLMQLPMNLVGSDPLFLLRLDSSHLLPVLGVIAGGLSIHYCLTNAFRCGDASVVIPLDFLRVPFIAIIGWAFYAEALDALVFAGGGLIILGVLWNVRAEARRVREIAPAPAAI